jgi:hypothetical protein
LFVRRTRADMSAAANVAVLPSTLPGAGAGLFAARDLAPSEDVVEYVGRRLCFSQARAVKDRMYMKMVSLDLHIDAADAATSSLARYINDHPSAQAINCRFATVDKTRVVVRAEPALAMCVLGVQLARDGAGLLAAAPVPARETVAVYSSCLWDEYYGPGLGRAIERGPEANCRLQKNPFIDGTTMVVSTQAVAAGQRFVLPVHVPETVAVVLTWPSELGEDVPPSLRHLALAVQTFASAPAHVVEAGLDRTELVLGALRCGRGLVPRRCVWVHVVPGRDCATAELVAVAHNFVPSAGRSGASSLSSAQSVPISVRPHDKLGDRRTPHLDVRALAHKLQRQMGHRVRATSEPGAGNHTLYSSLARRHAPNVQWGHADSICVRLPAMNPLAPGGDPNMLVRLVEDLVTCVKLDVCL